MLFHTERKWLLMRNPQSYLRSPNSLENLNVSVLLMEVSKCWKIVNFPKFQLKWRFSKHFTRPKQRVTLRKLFSPHRKKPYEWVIFFPSFCWLWDFLLKNLKLKKTTSNLRFLIIYCLVQILSFWDCFRMFWWWRYVFSLSCDFARPPD